jgi:hypothetical protein
LVAVIGYWVGRLPQVGLLVNIAATVWVGYDAATLQQRQRERFGRAFLSPILWAVFALFLWPIALPFYIARRSKEEARLEMILT